MTTPDPMAVLLGGDPVPAIATAEQRALLEWATANPLATSHPGMTKDGSRYSTPMPGEDKAKARTRVTTFSEALDDGEGLVRWRHRILAHGLAAYVDVQPSDGPGGHYDQAISKALHDAGEKLAADIGTALHLACEHLVAGTGVRPPAPWDADVAAYSAMLAAHGLRPVLSESVLWVPIGDGLCGTADLLVAGPWGDELRVLDIKTGSRTDRIGYACQLACYTAATHRWTDGGWEPLPALDRSVAYIAHLPAGSGTCELVRVTIDPALPALAATVRERRRQSNVSALFATVEAPAALPLDVPGAEAHEDAHAIDTAAPAWIGAPDDEVRAWMLGRVRAIVAAAGEPAKALSRRWPASTSATEPDTWSIADLLALDVLLAPVEVAAGIECDWPPVPAPTEAPEPEQEPVRLPPSAWDVPEPDGAIDQAEALRITAAFASLDDEPKMLAASWAKGGKIAGRRWAVGADDLTPRTLAIYGAVLACLTMWDTGGAPDCDLTTRAALSLILGEDVQPGWETGAILGALTIDQATRLAKLATSFEAHGEMADELGAACLRLAG